MYILNSINSSSLFDYDYTYHYSKYSCVRSFYFIHVVFCYIIFLSGIGAFITRLHPKIKPAHEWFGRIYILSMLYSTASSLLIHNTGLPLAVLISFVYCLGGLAIAWVFILVHKKELFNKVLKYKIKDDDLGEHIRKTQMEILENRTFVQRIFSYKSFHGILMFLSWFNIAGRIFASDQSGDFECYTYPIYKIDNYTNQTNVEITLVPEEDPDYARLPWANNELTWNLGLFFGPIVFAFLIGIIWTAITKKK